MTTQTKITRSDLKVFPSERLTDNADGGGMPIGKALTGADNELFDPIPAIAWLNGGFYARLVYMGVRRSDDEPLLGPYTAITVPPKNKNVSYLIFPATKYGEYRHEILQRIESYVVGSIENRMTLLGKQSKYAKIIQAYQRTDEPLPLVGDVYELKQDRAGYVKVNQFVKVIRVEAEERTFTRDNQDFKRMVVTLELTTKLKADFVGVDYPVTGYANPVCQIRDTSVADAATYCGVKPLVTPIIAKANSLKVASIFEKIIPTNTVPQPLLDKQISTSQTLFDSAKAGNDGVISLVINADNSDINSLYLPNACTPNSLKITTNSGDITDAGGNLIKSDSVIGTINYVDKLLTITDTADYRLYNLTFRPATGVHKISDTAKIDVTLNNRSSEYAITITPPPPLGTVSVDYRSQGTWYRVTDFGDGRLRGVSEQHGSGSVSSTTGTVNVSCGALPDVGSSIIFNWGSSTQYYNRAGQTCTAYMLLQLSDDADPASIALSWNDGTAKTATCDAAGNITGAWTGKYDLQTRQIRIDTSTNFNHPAGVLDISVTYGKTPKTHVQFNSSTRNADNTLSLDLADKAIKPHTLQIRYRLDITEYPKYMSLNAPAQSWVSQYLDLYDDGNGKLIDGAGAEHGSVDYATAKVTVSPTASVQVPRPKYINTPLGSEITSKDSTTTSYRRLFSGYDVIATTALLQATDVVEAWFYDTAPTTTTTDALTSGNIEIDLLPDFSEVIEPNSTYFSWGAKRYFERGGRLYTDLNVRNGNATLAGTLDKKTGKATLTNWQWTNGNPPNITSLATSITGNPVDAVTFRTLKAPIDSGMSVRAVSLDGELLIATADANGDFNANSIHGHVDVQFGVVDVRFGDKVVAAGNENEPWYNVDAVKDGNIFKPRHVFASTVMYTAFATSYLPINSDIVKIDTVRLPQDGRVPIYRKGDNILISNSKTDDLGSAFTGGKTINLSRNDVDRICITDSNNIPVDASKWDYDLDAGTITFTTPLDLSSYQMPLKAMHVQEERNRIVHADIDGTLTLLFATKRAYPIADTYVSSLLMSSNLQVRHSIPFTQRNWDGTWRDTPNGAQLLNKLNLTDNPMVLTDDGAISQRWLIRFTSGSQFELYGERLGFVGRFDTLTDLAPLNPWTSVPYFTIPKAAFGNDAPWSSQDVICFETWGTLMPVWILCAAQPTNEPQQGTDGFKYCFYGDTTELTN